MATDRGPAGGPTAPRSDVRKSSAAVTSASRPGVAASLSPAGTRRRRCRCGAGGGRSWTGISSSALHRLPQPRHLGSRQAPIFLGHTQSATTNPFVLGETCVLSCRASLAAAYLWQWRLVHQRFFIRLFSW
jgi:hypothetical protein